MVGSRIVVCPFCFALWWWLKNKFDRLSCWFFLMLVLHLCWTTLVLGFSVLCGGALNSFDIGWSKCFCLGYFVWFVSLLGCWIQILQTLVFLFDVLVVHLEQYRRWWLMCFLRENFYLFWLTLVFGWSLVDNIVKLRIRSRVICWRWRWRKINSYWIQGLGTLVFYYHLFSHLFSLLLVVVDC